MPITIVIDWFTIFVLSDNLSYTVPSHSYPTKLTLAPCIRVGWTSKVHPVCYVITRPYLGGAKGDRPTSPGASFLILYCEVDSDNPVHPEYGPGLLCCAIWNKWLMKLFVQVIRLFETSRWQIYGKIQSPFTLCGCLIITIVDKITIFSVIVNFLKLVEYFRRKIETPFNFGRNKNSNTWDLLGDKDLEHETD